MYISSCHVSSHTYLLSELSLENVAYGKPTAIQTTTHVAYRKWGNKDNLVDGVKSASSSGSGCSACFASNPVQGYWLVDLAANFYLSYVEITGVQGQRSSNPNGSDFNIGLSLSFIRKDRRNHQFLHR